MACRSAFVIPDAQTDGLGYGLAGVVTILVHARHSLLTTTFHPCLARCLREETRLKTFATGHILAAFWLSVLLTTLPRQPMATHTSALLLLPARSPSRRARATLPALFNRPSGLPKFLYSLRCAISYSLTRWNVFGQDTDKRCDS